MSGPVAPGLVDGPEGIRTAATADPALLDRVDLATRGARRGTDHALLQRHCGLLVADDHPDGEGYAYVAADGDPATVAATHESVARDLLRAIVAARAGSTVTIGHVTAANQWALDVALDARLAVRTYGYLAVRGTALPTAYLHHGSLL